MPTKMVEKERKEELQESGDRWSVTSKVGYSQEKESVYTENSLMYRADDNHFVTTNYNRSRDSEEAPVTGIQITIRKLPWEYFQ